MIKSLQRVIIALSSLTISTVVLSTTNPVVSHGQVSISQNRNITNINQGSDSGVINWDTFNVDTGATVNFIQPNTSSWTLNNVSLSYSDIKGTINANGNVILSNPHGILLHNGALIDVNSMILTTASLNKHDFINRNFSFSVDDANRYGAIINYGNIETDGPVALLASGIENHGVIISHLGDVNLAAGGGYVVDLSGQGLFSVQITGDLVAKARDKDGKALKHAIHNSGQVIAKNGAAIISAKAANNVIDNLLNVNGMVRANSAHMDGGKIVLNSHNGHTVVGGELTVSSDNGPAGTIEILGDEIIIKDTARVLADGKSGGEIYVGGSDKGQGPLPNSKKVKVEDGALISAKGHENQQSGKIILWADDYLEMSGNLDTSVGLDGFIETSSKKDFMINGHINAGIHGSWLLDPETILIRGGAGQIKFSLFDPVTTNSIGVEWLANQIGEIELEADSITIWVWPDSLKADSITFKSDEMLISTDITSYAPLVITNKTTGQFNELYGSGQIIVKEPVRLTKVQFSDKAGIPKIVADRAIERNEILSVKPRVIDGILRDADGLLPHLKISFEPSNGLAITNSLFRNSNTQIFTTLMDAFETMGSGTNASIKFLIDGRKATTISASMKKSDLSDAWQLATDYDYYHVDRLGFINIKRIADTEGDILVIKELTHPSLGKLIGIESSKNDNGYYRSFKHEDSGLIYYPHQNKFRYEKVEGDFYMAKNGSELIHSNGSGLSYNPTTKQFSHPNIGALKVNPRYPKQLINDDGLQYRPNANNAYHPAIGVLEIENGELKLYGLTYNPEDNTASHPAFGQLKIEDGKLKHEKSGFSYNATRNIAKHVEFGKFDLTSDNTLVHKNGLEFYPEYSEAYHPAIGILSVSPTDGNLTHYSGLTYDPENNTATHNEFGEFDLTSDNTLVHKNGLEFLPYDSTAYHPAIGYLSAEGDKLTHYSSELTYDPENNTATHKEFGEFNPEYNEETGVYTLKNANELEFLPYNSTAYHPAIGILSVSPTDGNITHESGLTYDPQNNTATHKEFGEFNPEYNEETGVYTLKNATELEFLPYNSTAYHPAIGILSVSPTDGNITHESGLTYDPENNTATHNEFGEFNPEYNEETGVYTLKNAKELEFLPYDSTAYHPDIGILSKDHEKLAEYRINTETTLNSAEPNTSPVTGGGYISTLVKPEPKTGGVTSADGSPPPQLTPGYQPSTEPGATDYPGQR